MIEEIRQRFRELIRKKDTEGIESLWLELLEGGAGIAQFRELVELLLKAEQRQLATTLLSVLIADRKEHQDYAAALEVLKYQAELNPEDRYLRRELAGCYRELYGTNPRFENYLSKSELIDNRPIGEAVRFLENCLAFDTGNSVYDNEQGVGRIVELNLMVDKLTVDFGRDKPVTYHIGAAFRHLIPLKADHFLIRRRDEPEKLRELAEQEPLALLKLLLAGFDRPLKPKEIREYLSGIVPENSWDGFWNRLSKIAANDPEIIVTSRPERSYQLTKPSRSSPDRKPETVAVPRTRGKVKRRIPEPPAHDAPQPPPEPESIQEEAAASVPGSGEPAAPIPQPAASGEPAGAEPQPATPDDYLKLLKLDSSPEYWKRILSQAYQALPKEWQVVYRQAFLDTTDKRLWTVIIRQLGNQSAFFQELVQEVTTYYRKYPAQFIYLYQNAARYGLSPEIKGLVSRLLDLLDSDKHKPFWSEIANWLAAENDRLYRDCCAQLSREEAEAMWQKVNRSQFFEEYRKAELLKLIQSCHPDVGAAEKRPEEVIFCTREGIERKQAELRQLVDVELPQSSEEIGRARSFGDLSENYEYKIAKEKQARLIAKINQMQRDLAIARPIEFDKVTADRVGIGTRVKVQELPSGEIQEFTILGPWDIDPDRGIISYQAPFAQRLMNHTRGDFVPLNPNQPTGRGHKILEISKVLPGKE